MKRIIALVFALALLLNCAVLAETTGEVQGFQATAEWYGTADYSVLQGKKIGITVQSLTNTYWIGVMGALKEALAGYGAECTIVSCNDNTTLQNIQAERFIEEGCDIIMIHPSDAANIEDTCAKAREQGIKVMCWDDPMENTDVNWILNNHDLGYEIGSMAGAFIAEHYSADNKAEVIVIGYPQTAILLQRENAIIEGMNAAATDLYEVVANVSAISPYDALIGTETMLGIHPNAKVVVGIGAGPMIGADEALTTLVGGAIPDDMGVFTADVTLQQLEHLKDEAYPARGMIGYEGSDKDTANSCAAMFAKLLTDGFEAKNVYRAFFPITDANADAILAEMQ